MNKNNKGPEEPVHCIQWAKAWWSKMNNKRIQKSKGKYLRKNADYIMDIIFSLLFKNNYNINLIEKLERAKNIQNIEFLKN